MTTKLTKIMVQPITVIFRHLQSKTRVQIWLYEQMSSRLEGRIIGFDEFMNIVLEDAVEVSQKTMKRTKLGRVLVKGDNITLITKAPDAEEDEGRDES